MLTRLIPLMMLCSFAIPALVQAQPQDEPAVDVRRPVPPALLVKVDQDQPMTALPVARMEVDVDIHGILAKTSITLEFANPHDRVLEGDLYFPLPEGVTVSGYAIDLNGQMVDAVVVEKHTARIIFETEQRKGIDPGIVEWVAGNNFKTRIWPIPAQGSRTVRVDFVSTLTGEGDVLDMPMTFGAEINEVKIRVTARHVTSAPTVSAPWLDDFQISPDGDAFSGEVLLKRTRPDGALKIQLARLPATVTMVGQDQAETFFVVSTKLPRVNIETTVEKPRVIALLWDASRSRLGHDLERELSLLEAHLKHLGDVAVYVQVFRDDLDELRLFPIQNGDASELLAYLKAQPLDGGTDLSNVVLPASNVDLYDVEVLSRIRLQPMRIDYTLLFTDGQGNLNRDLPAAIHPTQIKPGQDAPIAGAPVYIIATNPAANHPILRHIAGASNGRYFNLTTTTDDQATVTAIGQPSFGLLRIEHDAGQFADVLPQTAVALSPNQRVAISGRLLADEAKLTLIYGVGTEQRIHQAVTVKRSDASRDPLVGRFWAQQKIDSLLAMPDQNHDQLVALGRQFGLVTPGTSLMVLETLEQHLTYGIAPAASRKAMREAFDAEIQKINLAEKQSREEHIAEVASVWEERKKRWKTRFDWQKIKLAQAEPGQGSNPFDFNELREGQAAQPAARPEDTATEQTPPVAESSTDSMLEDVRNLIRDSNDGRSLDEIPNFTEAPTFDLTNVLEEGAGSGGGGGLFADEGADDAQGGEMLDETTREGGPIRTMISAWDPDTPYLTEIKQAQGPAARYDAYLKQREKPEYASNPAFYFDCAELFFQMKQTALAARVLTNVLELELQNAALIRVVAHRLQQAGQLDDAVALFRIVKTMRPEEPQSYRDLALALDQRASQAADTSITFADRVEALELLNHVVENPWDDRFQNIQQIALMEANRLAGLLEKQQGDTPFVNPIDERLRGELDVDLRIVLTWDADLTDMDLWIIEPTGEKCFYSQPRSQIGGTMSDDFTQGYGPEEYWLRNTMPGRYQIRANYFSSNAQRLTGGVTLQATIIRHFGDPQRETREAVSVRLVDNKQVIDIATIEAAP